MASDELKIVLEDVKEKFDTVIEGYNLLSEKIDRLANQNEMEHEQLQTEITGLKKDLNKHRSSTELHGAPKRKKVSNNIHLPTTAWVAELVDARDLKSLVP